MCVDQCFKSVNWREVCGCVVWWERDLRADLRRLPEERTTLSTECVQCASADQALQRAERQLRAARQVIQRSEVAAARPLRNDALCGS